MGSCQGILCGGETSPWLCVGNRLRGLKGSRRQEEAPAGSRFRLESQLRKTRWEVRLCVGWPGRRATEGGDKAEEGFCHDWLEERAGGKKMEEFFRTLFSVAPPPAFSAEPAP